jgi:hypothetical protein
MQIAVKDASIDRVVLIEASDVLFITIEKNDVVYHTDTHSFRHLDSLEEVGAGVKLLYGFERLDRNFVVNMSKATIFDSSKNILFFKSDTVKGSKFAAVSGPNIKKVKDYMKEKNLEVIGKAPVFMQILLNTKFLKVSAKLEREVVKLKNALQMMDVSYKLVHNESMFEFSLVH